MPSINARAGLSKAARIALSAALAIGLWPAFAPTAKEAVAAQAPQPSVRDHIVESLDGSHASAGSFFSKAARTIFGAGADDVLSDTGHDVVLKYTMADLSAVSDGETIDSVWSDPDSAGSKILGQYTSFADVYDPGDGGDYYVAFVDATRINGAGEVLDAQFAIANLQGQTVDDVFYDKDAGIAYIPKSHYFDENGIELAFGLQAQVLVGMDLSSDRSVSIGVAVESEAEGVAPSAESAVAAVDPVEPTVTIPVVSVADAGKVSLDDIELYVDDSDSPVELDSDNASYNQETGELEFAMSGLSITSLKAKIVSATAAQARVQAPDSLATWPIGEFTGLDTSAISEGQLIQYQGYVRQSETGFSDTPDWTHIRDARAFAAKYGYTWSRNGQGLSGPGTTVGLMDAILNGSTWDSLGGGDMTTLENSTAHMSIDVPFVFDGPSGDMAGTNWDGVYDEWNNQVYLHGGSDAVANAPTLAAYCAHASHSVDASGSWKYSTINMRVLKISDDYIVLGFVLPYFYTQSGVAVYKFKVESTGALQLAKSSGSSSMTDGNGCYSLEGAVFGVYDANGDEVAELTTDASGNTPAAEGLRAGWYTVKEKKASPGYLLAEDQSVYVAAGETTSFSVVEPPANDPDRVRVQKLDKETGEASPLGKGTLSDAHYRFDYYDGYYGSAEEAQASGEPTRTWTMRTDGNGVTQLTYGEDYKVSGDGFYYDPSGLAITMPLGTYVVTEVKAPDGYLLDAEPHVVRVKLDADAQRPYVEGDISASDLNPAEGDMEAFEQVKRGDVAFSKFDDRTSRPLPGVPFKVTSKTTGESHVVVTDENGAVDTSSAFVPHTSNTNANDAVEDGGEYASAAGVWFAGSAEGGGEPDDSLGAMPYDDYSVEELPCAANEGLQLVSFDLTVSRDSFKVDLGSVDDPEAVIATAATDGDDGDKSVSMSPSASIVDRVSYSGLIPGSPYRLVGTVFDKTAGSMLSVAGHEISVETDFTPASSSGHEELRFEFDASGLAGHELVVFESLFDAEGREVAVHADENDADQTVAVVAPELETSAADEFDGDKSAVAGPTVAIVDRVSYKNLNVGVEYSLESTLMRVVEGEDGSLSAEPVVDADGRPVEGVLVDSQGSAVEGNVFATEDSRGSADVRFELDARTLAGEKLVVFEKLLRGGDVVASHEDPSSEAQSVAIVEPSIATTATDADDGDKTVVPDSVASIADEVSYENLLPGMTYVLHGIVMDAETGLPLVSGEEPEGIDHEAFVSFLQDLAAAYGLGSYEEGADGEKTFVSDVVSNAPWGENSSLGGVLQAEGPFVQRPCDLAAAQALMDANPEFASLLASSSREFTPAFATGAEVLEISFDASAYADAAEPVPAVVFEVLTLGDTVTAVHADYADEGQAVSIAPAKISTEATDATDGDHTLVVSSEARIVDRVSYEGLAAGEQHTVSGILMDKETGEPLLVGDKKAEASLSFTPNASSGYVDVVFDLDATELAGREVVVFEKMGKDDPSSGEKTVVAVHEDIDDAAQTVFFDEGPGEGSSTEGEAYDQTGFARDAFQALVGALTLAGLAAATYAMHQRRRADEPKA